MQHLQQLVPTDDGKFNVPPCKQRSCYCGQTNASHFTAINKGKGHYLKQHPDCELNCVIVTCLCVILFQEFSQCLCITTNCACLFVKTAKTHLRKKLNCIDKTDNLAGSGGGSHKQFVVIWDCENTINELIKPVSRLWLTYLSCMVCSRRA